MVFFVNACDEFPLSFEVVSSVTRCQYRFYKFFYIALIIGTKETFNWAKYQYLYITFELSKEMLYPGKIDMYHRPLKRKKIIEEKFKLLKLAIWCRI